ncbi:MAG TPA: orotidine-5'-phosphate decarboxylase [Micropepsaceae bacterium]
MIPNANPIFVALDTPILDTATALAARVAPYVGGLKLGLEFVSANGPEGVRAIVKSGAPVFLDVKLHDIPNTVAGAMKALAPLGAAIVNVHASGGAAMMRAAAEAAAIVQPRPKLLAVTVLTSLEAADLAAMGISGTPLEQVVRLARLAKASGIDGVVCSPREIAGVRAACGADFLIVTPGVRPAGGELGDQKRVMTPKEALAAGADILVIGRPITAASDPAQAARAILESLRT